MCTMVHQDTHTHTQTRKNTHTETRTHTHTHTHTKTHTHTRNHATQGSLPLNKDIKFDVCGKGHFTIF